MYIMQARGLHFLHQRALDASGILQAQGSGAAARVKYLFGSAGDSRTARRSIGFQEPLSEATFLVILLPNET